LAIYLQKKSFYAAKKTDCLKPKKQKRLIKLAAFVVGADTIAPLEQSKT